MEQQDVFAIRRAALWGNALWPLLATAAQCIAELGSNDPGVRRVALAALVLAAAVMAAFIVGMVRRTPRLTIGRSGLVMYLPLRSRRFEWGRVHEVSAETYKNAMSIRVSPITGTDLRIPTSWLKNTVETYVSMRSAFDSHRSSGC